HDDLVSRSSHLPHVVARSEEHTSELQSQSNLVCRLLLEKKKKLGVQVAEVLGRRLRGSLQRFLSVKRPLTSDSLLCRTQPILRRNPHARRLSGRAAQSSS